jgi:hypothetical protein
MPGTERVIAFSQLAVKGLMSAPLFVNMTAGTSNTIIFIDPTCFGSDFSESDPDPPYIHFHPTH